MFDWAGAANRKQEQSIQMITIQDSILGSLWLNPPFKTKAILKRAVQLMIFPIFVENK